MTIFEQERDFPTSQNWEGAIVHSRPQSRCHRGKTRNSGFK